MPIDLAFNVALGLGFVLCARDRVRADGIFAFPAFHLVAAFATILVLPLTAYLVLAHPAWSWMYLADPEAAPALVVLPLIALQAGGVLAGWAIGGRLLRARRDRPVIVAFLVTLVVVLSVSVATWHRLGRYGTFGEFHDGRALDLMGVKLGYVLIGALLGIAAAVAFTAVELARDSRRVRSR